MDHAAQPGLDARDDLGGLLANVRGALPRRVAYIGGSLSRGLDAARGGHLGGLHSRLAASCAASTPRAAAS